VDLGDARTDGPKLSLKLYHTREFQSDYQHLMTEAPHKQSCGGNREQTRSYRLCLLLEMIGLTCQSAKRAFFFETIRLHYIFEPTDFYVDAHPS